MLTLEVGDPLIPALARRRRKLQAIATLVQLPNFWEQLLRWEKTAWECDRSLFGNGGSGAVSSRTQLITQNSGLQALSSKESAKNQCVINSVQLLMRCPFVRMNRYRSEKPVQGGLDACPPRNELYQIFYNHQFDNQKHTRREHHFITFLQIFSVTNGI